MWVLTPSSFCAIWLQFCGAGAHKYLPVFFPILMRALERACAATPQDEEEDEEEAGDLILLRQACVYGITQVPIDFQSQERGPSLYL